MSDLGEEERAEWQRPRDFLNQHTSNCAHVLVYDERTDITKGVINTPAGKLEGVAKAAGAPNLFASCGAPG